MVGERRKTLPDTTAQTGHDRLKKNKNKGGGLGGAGRVDDYDQNQCQCTGFCFLFQCYILLSVIKSLFSFLIRERKSF